MDIKSQLQRPLLVVVLGTALLSLPHQLCSAETPPSTLAQETAKAAHPGARPYFEALKLAAQRNPSDHDQIQRLLKQAVHQGYSHAEIYVAVCRLHGSNGYRKKPREAAKLFLQAAERGNAYAMFNIGLCYLQGQGTNMNQKKAEGWFLAALKPEADYSLPVPPEGFQMPASVSGAEAKVSGQIPVSLADQTRAAIHNALGIYYANINQRDKAHPHLVQAATMGPNNRAGIYSAAVNAAINYAFGLGTVQDTDAASRMLALSKSLNRRQSMQFLLSSEASGLVDSFAQGDLEDQINSHSELMEIELMNRIGDTFGSPGSASYDPTKADEWYRLSAENGSPWAMTALALLHLPNGLSWPDYEGSFEWLKKASATNKFLLATENYSICLAKGIGTTPDPEKAAEIWRGIADKSIIANLGLQGRCPDHPVSLWGMYQLLQKEVEAGSTRAKRIQGIFLISGYVTQPDPRKAVLLLKEAAEAGDGEALMDCALIGGRVPILFAKPGEDASPILLDYMQRAAQQGSSKAFLRLGEIYQSGELGTKDLSKALEYFGKIPEDSPEYEKALIGLATTRQELADQSLGQGSRQNYQEHVTAMYTALARARGRDSGLASCVLGLLAKAGVHEPKDLTKAFELLSEAADRGGADGIAHLQLGEMLEQGQGVSISLNEAAYHYRLAVIAENDRALKHLCRLYRQGKGIVQDWNRCEYWHKVLAATGNEDGHIGVGLSLLGREAYTEALLYYTQFSKTGSQRMRGHAFAQLAKMHQAGLGTRASKRKAANLLEEAVKLGDPEALYLKGIGLLTDSKEKEGLTLLRQAADKGHPEAHLKLGLLRLEQNAGAALDTEAYKDVLKAAKAGSSDAMAVLIDWYLEGRNTLLNAASIQYLNTLLEAYEDPRAAELGSRLQDGVASGTGGRPGQSLRR